MKVLKVKDTYGDEHTLTLPETLDEFDLNAKIAFDVCAEDVNLWLKQSLDDESLATDSNYYLYLLSKGISEFLSYPLHKLLRLDVADLMDDKGSLKLYVLEKHIKELKGEKMDIDFDSAENLLSNLYFYIKDLISTYEFEFKDKDNFIFEWDGDIWEVPYMIKNILGGKSFSKVSVAQSVTVLNIKKALDDLNSSKTRDLTNTQDVMDSRFTSALKMIACLVKLEGENLPLDDVPFQELLKNRMARFAKMDFKTAYDIIFFSMHTTLH